MLNLVNCHAIGQQPQVHVRTKTQLVNLVVKPIVLIREAGLDKSRPKCGPLNLSFTAYLEEEEEKEALKAMVQGFMPT